jgi:streptogramin lyase
MPACGPVFGPLHRSCRVRQCSGRAHRFGGAARGGAVQHCAPVVVLAALLGGASAQAVVKTFTTFVLLTANAQPHRIVAGVDGNLWFTEMGADRIGKLGTNGTL